MKSLKKYKYIILGAGPTGLSVANRLLELGEKSFIVIEKEKEAGGLCRTKKIDNSYIDFGGGHFLDVKNKKVLDFLFKFFPKDNWNTFSRISNIIKSDLEIGYPYEANIWQFKEKEQVDYLLSIAKAGCNNDIKMPKKFSNWIIWKLGQKIADEYMIPYNDKIWSCDLDKLGTYWLEKLPSVSFSDTFLSCIHKRVYGTLPAHAKFYYPKKDGYGKVWTIMGDALGEKLLLGQEVNDIDFKKNIVNKKYKGDIIINSIPWRELAKKSNFPVKIKNKIKNLKYNSVVIEYEKDNYNSKAHWLYIPDKKLKHHRLLLLNNFQENAVGYWKETNLKRFNKNTENWFYINKYAYPLNTINKTKNIKAILKWFKKYSIYGVGRWGTWEHINSDVAVSSGIKFAEEIINQK